METKNEIILYQPDNTVKLNVLLENETVWLTQAQIAELFQTTKQNISLHTGNIFKEKELDRFSVVKDFLTTANDGKAYKTKFYNLDVIISIGYRVKSIRGTHFRQWANKVLKEYLLKGYSINQRLRDAEERIGVRLATHDKQIETLNEKVDFFVRTSMPPVEGIFFDGQIYDAYAFVSDLIRKAKKSIVLTDNYIDDSVFTMLSKRGKGVVATIYTKQISRQLALDLKKYNEEYPPIKVQVTSQYHDRFLIFDDAELYHIGASLKDLGKKIFAFSKLEIGTEKILMSQSLFLRQRTENVPLR
jgi:hypothetical protein